MKNNLVYGIDNLTYGSSVFHKLMVQDGIGENGKNLTIMVLIYNRSKNTIDLLKSIKKCIPNFAGEVLLVDNNSDKDDLKKVEKMIKTMPYKLRIESLDKNYGVSGGRNRGIEFVNTDWVFSLDNDIYMVENPLPYINDSLQTLGCHFLNVPLMDEKGENYFLNGGHLYFDIDLDGLIHVGGGSLYKQIDVNEYNDVGPSLSTFFAGGTSVFKKSTFIKLGKYDEGYFIGFEDIDFSIRLFQNGYKIGNCVGKCLIHNHVIDQNKSSIEYERNRFSSTIIYNSAMHFEDKWGYKVWNKNTAMWLEQRQKDLKINDEKEKAIVKIEEEKKKIALVVDVYNWCFYNISMQLKKYLSKYFDIEIIVMENYNNIYQLIFYLKKFDLVHFFWRGHLLWINDIDDKVFVDLYGVSYEYFIKNILSKVNITTSVYDHLYLGKDIKTTRKILSYTDNYTVSSNILSNIYKKQRGIPKPKCTITDGVDLEKFYPVNKDKYKNISTRKVVFGWVGNSAWNEKDEDFKGFNTIIKPVLSELKSEGYNIDFNFADKQIKQIPFDKMNDYYNSIDVLLCASKAEGTPNPVLEAMATGTIVISTNVGIVSDALGKMQSEYILEERTKECLKNKIIKLLNNIDNFNDLKNENLEEIKKWTWEIKANEFKNFFSKVLEKDNN